MTIHWDFWVIKLPLIFLGPLAVNGIFDTDVSYWGMVLFLSVFMFLSLVKIETTFRNR